jgi:sensor histidine kinase YesM
VLLCGGDKSTQHRDVGRTKGATTMSYIELGGLVLGTGLIAAFICVLLHLILHRDTFRRYHEIGYAVFLQLGVIFAVLLAFVFNNVWSNYNIASQAIDSECGSLHGIAILSGRLPSPARAAILGDLHAYLTTVLDREWPDMQQRHESQAADTKFQSLWQTVETANMDPMDSQIRGQLLSLLAEAHQSRETRLYQMKQGIPGLVWGLLIIFACGLIGCMLIFAAEASLSKAVLVGVFTSCLTLALLTVRELDFPFESALQLSSQDFNQTLKKVDRLIAAARPPAPTAPE